MNKKNFLSFIYHFSSIKAFTLIELLVVIGIISILATIVLVAVNPLESIAKARDSQRKTTIATLITILRSYSTSSGDYPEANQTWMNPLLQTQDLASIPPEVEAVLIGSVSCNFNSVNGYCYHRDNDGKIVLYTGLEAGIEKSKCNDGESPWYLWSSCDGRMGVVCTNQISEPISDSSESSCGFVYRD